MKTIKKSLVIIIALTIFATNLAGCTNRSKDEEGVLYIGIYNAGYGTAFVDEIGKLFEAKTGIKVRKSNISSSSNVFTALESGMTNTDIFFTNQPIFSYLYNSKTIAGITYESLIENLDDLYEATLDNENITISEKMLPEYLNFHAFEKQEKTHYYSFPWINGMTGILVNNKVWNADWAIPRTTNELKSLCDDIKSSGKVPFIYCLDDSYWGDGIAYAWAMQYEGQENIKKFESGYEKNGGKRYVPELMLYDGFLESLKVMESLLEVENNYMHYYSKSLDFTAVQNVFLEGDDNIVMMPNGDWVEREMSANYTPEEIDIQFMKMPIISSLGEKLGVTEQELCSIIDFIDEKSESVTFSSTKGFTYEQVISNVRDARNIIPTYSPQHVAFIPAYSNEIEKAKEFLKFMASNEGIEAFVKSTGGYTLPFKYNYLESPMTKDKMSNFTKSVFNHLKKGIPTQFTAKDRIFAIGGLNLPGMNLERYYETFLSSEKGGGFKSASQILLEDYQFIESRWNLIKINSGIQ